METIVYAEIKVSGCYAVLVLNGIPLLSTGRFGATFSSMPVRQFLVQKPNRLELLVEPVTRPSLARHEQRKLTLDEGYAIARLVRYEDGVPALVENGELLLAHHWAADGREDTYPKVFTGEVSLPDGKHHWAWEDAPALTMNDELRAEAVAVVEEVMGAVARGDLDGFIALTDAKLRDVKVAYPLRTDASIRDELREFLAFWNKSGAPLYPLDDEAHDFRLVAGGRMLEAVDDDGMASMRFCDPSDQAALPYPLYLARLDGRLRVVR
jgi:hypothetical protein